MAREARGDEMDERQQLAALLAAHRRDRGMTHRALAGASGVSVGTISRLEHGRVDRPRLDTIELLAAALRLSDVERARFVASAPGRAASGRPGAGHNLPQDLPAFIGRREELAHARRLLRAQRFVTLTGTAGCGKTRLAIAAAEGLLADFPDGVSFVDLAALQDAALVADTLARTLGVQLIARRSPHESVREHLSEKRLLLILDNFEQLRPAAPLIDDLLGHCPALRILVTSRGRLRRPAEVVYPVPPLDLPAARQPIEPHRLAEFGAIALFNERARVARQGIPLPDDTLTTVLRICRSLDGLPLAIELAAARCAILSPAEILQRLADQPTLLRGRRGGPLRHRSLQAALEWSGTLLAQGVRHLFRRLAAFSGGFDLEAIAAICNPDGELGVATVEALQELAEQHLLRATHDGTTTRYALLEPIRQHAAQQLAQTPDAPTCHARYASYYATFARVAQDGLTTAAQAAWMARLALDYDNLRAALRYLIASGEAERALQLAGRLTTYWTTTNRMPEGRRFLELALAGAGPIAPATRAAALLDLAYFVAHAADLPTAHTYLLQGSALARRLGDTGLLVRYLQYIENFARQRGDYSAAERACHEEIALCRANGDRKQEIYSRYKLGFYACEQGNLAHGRALLAECLPLFRQIGDPTRLAWCLEACGEAALYHGDYAAAQPALDEALQIFTASDAIGGMSECWDALGRLAWLQRDFPRARCAFTRSLNLRRERSPILWKVLKSLESFALLAATAGQPRKAARLAGAAAELRTQHDLAHVPLNRGFLDEALAPARVTIGAASWEAAWAAGRILSPAEAIALALSDGDVA